MVTLHFIAPQRAGCHERKRAFYLLERQKVPGSDRVGMVTADHWVAPPERQLLDPGTVVGMEMLPPRDSYPPKPILAPLAFPFTGHDTLRSTGAQDP
jgi:hypothetical protein